jgi:hypothetical protein
MVVFELIGGSWRGYQRMTTTRLNILYFGRGFGVQTLISPPRLRLLLPVLLFLQLDVGRLLANTFGVERLLANTFGVGCWTLASDSVPVVQRIERGFPKAKGALLLVFAPLVYRAQNVIRQLVETTSASSAVIMNELILRCPGDTTG